jgi:hypothetical protein
VAAAAGGCDDGCAWCYFPGMHEVIEKHCAEDIVAGILVDGDGKNPMMHSYF